MPTLAYNKFSENILLNLLNLNSLLTDEQREVGLQTILSTDKSNLSLQFEIDGGSVRSSPAAPHGNTSEGLQGSYAMENCDPQRYDNLV